MEARRATVTDVAHIYFNLATGERVVTLAGDTQTAGADSATNSLETVWSTEAHQPCVDAGATTSFYYPLDDPGSSTLMSGATLAETIDVPLDTVVDCVRIHWVTEHQDTDDDSDGLGDGVVGLGGEWGYFEPDDGSSDNYCGRYGLISFLFTDLPGKIPGAEGVARYTADIDLAATFTGTSLTFEIGDSDGDRQGAAAHNPFVSQGDYNFDGQIDTDMDGDGLFDLTWRVRFYQPGRYDLDGDGQIDGEIAPGLADAIGLSLGFPLGAIFDSEGDWTGQVDPAVSGAGTGAEDFSTFYRNGLGGEYIGRNNFGGLSCDMAPGGGPGFTPAAIIEHMLLRSAPSGGHCLDFTGDGQVNFFDLSLYMSWFNQCLPRADLNGDGECDFFDISLFIAWFNDGCPGFPDP